MEQTHEFDVVVVGAGAGGLSAALAAALAGMKTILVEKTAVFGGTSAISGGIVWVPNSPHMQRAGVADSAESASLYLDSIVGDKVPKSRRDRYVRAAPEMIRDYESRTKWARFGYVNGYPDYYPEAPGGLAAGRGVDAQLLPASRLGDDLHLLRRRAGGVSSRGLTITARELRYINMMNRTWAGRRTALRVGVRYIRTRLRGELLSAGGALVSRLWLALRETGTPVWLSTPLEDLVVEDGRVVGVVVTHEETRVTLAASRGVILATGGFSRSPELRERYLPSPTSVDWSAVPEGQTGDAIGPAVRAGAALDLMDAMWGHPSAVLARPGAGPTVMMLLGERALPGTVIVNGAGKRYLNESLPYTEALGEMYRNNQPGATTIPSWFILDQRVSDRYVVLGRRPGESFPEEWIQSGFVHRADNLAQLAEKMAVDAASLEQTILHWNQMVRSGHDSDFARGDSAYDRYYGDPTLEHPNLQVIDKPPYYAFQVYPCDTGTKGGFITDDDARVMREDGSPVPGLYATGNCSAAVMGYSYAGPGATIGPAMTFGWLGARHATASPRDGGIAAAR